MPCNHTLDFTVLAETNNMCGLWDRIFFISVGVLFGSSFTLFVVSTIRTHCARAA